MIKTSLNLALFASVLAFAIAVPQFYFYNEDPMLRNDLFEGDIILPDDLDQLSFSPKGLYQKPGLFQGKWSNGIIPYSVDPNAGYTPSESLVIFNAMKHIEDKTRVNGKDCIKFKVRSSESSYINISSLEGCYSYVGRQYLQSPQQVSLRRPYGPNEGHCMWHGTVVHELLHAIGFFHEQSRADRDNYITILSENIIQGTENNFQKVTSGYDYLNEPYDLMSIMHYESTAFSKNGQPTIIPKDPSIQLVNAAYKDGLTRIDIAEIQKAYGCI